MACHVTPLRSSLTVLHGKLQSAVSDREGVFHLWDERGEWLHEMQCVLVYIKVELEFGKKRREEGKETEEGSRKDKRSQQLGGEAPRARPAHTQKTHNNFKKLFCFSNSKIRLLVI